MTRPIVSGNLPAEYAERITDTDEGYTPAEEAEIERRTDEIINDRIAYGDISDLLDELDYAAYAPELQRACRNTEKDVMAVRNAIVLIRRTLQIAATRAWGEEAREQAEQEMKGNQ